jgi:hypothetical protein
VKRISLVLQAFAVLAICGGLLWSADGPDAEPVIRYGEPKLVGRLENPRIKESSGLVWGRRNAGVIWTHNDSGDGANFFAINKAGEDLGVWEYPGVRPVDWEDIASVKLDNIDYLLLCDVGDNKATRKSCAIYLVPEPAVDPDKRGQKGEVRVVKTMRFSYEDGPHNCEAVMVDPIDKTVILVTKVLLGECGVYTLSMKEAIDARYAKKLTSLRIAIVTGGDISPDGRRMVLVTMGPAYEYHRLPGESWKSAMTREPREIALPPRYQGESICYGPDGKTIYVGSEGEKSVLWELPVIEGK